MRVEKQGNNTAVVVPDEIIDITNSKELKEHLLTLYEEGVNLITFDFSNVTAIDSSGLGKLLLFQKKLKERDGELRIINVNSEHIRNTFNMIHLYKVINID